MTTSTAPRLLRRDDVSRRIGLSYATFRRLELAGDFPQRVHVGPHSVAWVEEEVSEWIRLRMASRKAPPASVVIQAEIAP